SNHCFPKNSQFVDTQEDVIQAYQACGIYNTLKSDIPSLFGISLQDVDEYVKRWTFCFFMDTNYIGLRRVRRYLGGDCSRLYACCVPGYMDGFAGGRFSRWV
ncbi:MAG: hypothetical protein HZB65_00200, partial [Candidatus Aenigmarchaeota archaeon]|nr:hypothetical protein [Candidatus Aenigmarchaeota archaeon]